MAGTAIRTYCKRRQITQSQIAKEIAVSDPIMSYITQGRMLPTFAQAERIAEILGTTVGRLWTEEQLAAMSEENELSPRTAKTNSGAGR